MRTLTLLALLGKISAQDIPGRQPSYINGCTETGGTLVLDPDTNTPTGECTPPATNDPGYAENCQRWGLTNQCDYVFGPSDQNEVDPTVYRAKRWQIIAGGPLHNRLWSIEELFQAEAIRVTLTCAAGDQRPILDQASDYSGNPEKFAEYFFHGIEDKDIMHRYKELKPGDPLYNTDPDPYPTYPCDSADASGTGLQPMGSLMKPDYVKFAPGEADGITIPNPNEPNGGKSETWYDVSNPPTQCDNTNGQSCCVNEASYTKNIGMEWPDVNDAANDHKYVSCAVNENLWIQVYDGWKFVPNAYNPQASPPTYKPLTYGRFTDKESGCLETGDQLKFYANYAKAGSGECQGTDECFNNRNDRYIQNITDPNFNRDLPWSPYHNCYAAGKDQTVGALPSLSFSDCHEQSMQFFLQVLDEDTNGNWPMRMESFYIKASMQSVFQSLNIFPTDIMRVDFYITKNGVGRPQSVSLTPKDYAAVCTQFAVADRITCSSFNVYCTSATDKIVLRVTGGGEYLYEEKECKTLLEEKFGGDGVTKWNDMQTLATQLEGSDKLEGAGEDQISKFLITYTNTGAIKRVANVNWFYDTYTVSQESKCYTGDAFPFEVPQCKLQECDGNNDEDAVCPDSGTWPLGLADLFLHNDVLNQAISGYATHDAMPAAWVAPPTESTWTGTTYTLTPTSSPASLDLGTWYDFDAFEETGGYTGEMTITALPGCGALTIYTDAEQVEGEWVFDNAASRAARVGSHVDVDTQLISFDPAASPACEDGAQAAGELEFKGAFVAATSAFSSFVTQTAGAAKLAGLASLTALLAYLY